MSNKEIDEINDVLLSSTMKLPVNFIQRNRDRVEKSTTAVRTMSKNFANAKSNNTPLKDIQEIMSLLNYGNADDEKDNRNFIEVDQFHGTNSGDETIISTFSALMQNRFHSIGEYRNLAEMIPEIKRVIKIRARDTIARNEITGKAVTLGYNHPDPDTKEEVEKILENLVEEIDLDKRVLPWNYEALVESVKPVALIPYKDIIDQVIETRKAQLRTGQKEERISYESFIDEDITESSLTAPDKPGDRMMIDRVVDEVLNDPTFQSNLEDGLMETVIEHRRFLESKGQEVSHSFESIEPVFEFEKTSNESASVKVNDNYKNLRSSIRDIVETISQNITVVDKNRPYAQFKNKVPEEIFKEYEESGNLYDGPMTGKSEINKKASKKLQRTRNKMGDVMIMPMAPEDVIPVVINGQNIGFYIVESNDFGFANKLRKSSKFSFTEMIKNTGHMNDDAVMGSHNDVSRYISNAQSLIAQSGILDPNQGENRGDGGGLNQAMMDVLFRTVGYKLNQKGIAEDKSFRDAIMALLRQGHILNKNVRFTFIPADNMIYYAPNVDSNGLPVSVMDGSLLMGYMYISMMVSGNLLNLMKSSDKEKVVFDVGMSRQVGQTIQNIRKNFETRQITAGTLFQNLATVMRNTSTYSRVYVPSVKGSMLYDVEQMQRGPDYQVDEMFLERLLNSLVSLFGIPHSILNQLNDTEFSRSIAMSHSEYRSEQVSLQAIYRDDLVLKLIRRIINLSTREDLMYKDKDGKLKHIQTEFITFTPKPPVYLTLATSSEEFSQVDELTRNLVEVVYGQDSEDPSYRIKKDAMRKKLFRHYFHGVDWTVVDDYYREVEEEYPDAKIKEMIAKKIDDKSNEDDSSGGGMGW